jgi:glycosyltransferase involved in cell wall biosynthesis
MDILLCCEHFHPSVGGVQKMIHEIGLRFVIKGHKVTVATSWRADRKEDSVDGMEIHSFKVTGNTALGMRGEIDKYQGFLINGQFDFLLVMAAQQWTFDAMLPVLDRIRYKKLHIPCGYSGFYLKKYGEYYRDMETHLRKFDQLIYNSTDYRDINFARQRNVSNINIIPAGASELEFLNPDKGGILEKLGIDKGDFVYLSVGAPAFNKGHKEILQAYLLLDVPFCSTLVLNGNYDIDNAMALRNAVLSPWTTLKELARRILGRSPFNIIRLARVSKNQKKKVIFANLEREELIRLFFNADLFLFASHIEYSPLVIFECLAAGLPFLSIPVGNVDEIIKWSGGGILCPGKKSKEGFSSVEPLAFSKEIRKLSLDTEKRNRLSASGRQAWLENFTWESITNRIENLATRGHE